MKVYEYSRHDAVGLAQILRRGDVTADELQSCALKAIEAMNPTLNFMSGAPVPMPINAVTGPFSGVPILLKEGHACAGLPLAQGSRLTAGLKAPQDSEFVRRLKATGVRILGSTTAPEFGIYNVTESKLHGATRNPWNLDHSPGGSSGGSSVAVSAGVVPVASSSDGGGSIRGPAHCTGTFGLKPSRGRNPTSNGDGGLFPFAHFHVTSRSVRDSAAFLDSLHGPVLGSRYSVPPPARPFLEEVGAPTGKLRIAVTVTSPSPTALSPECLKGISDAAKLCEQLGHHVEEGAPIVDWSKVMGAFIQSWICVLPSALETLSKLTGRPLSPDTLEIKTLEAYELAKQLKPEDLFRADAFFQEVRRSVDVFFQKYDAWIMPSGVSQAPLIGQFDPSAPGTESNLDYGWRSLNDYSAFTPLQNITGHPAASVPLIQGSNGLPVGIQLVTRMGDEATLLRLASQLEMAHPWSGRIPPNSALHLRQ
jgi:amidase